MIATVFTPNGIVVATASFDSFYEHIESEDGMMLSPIQIEGLPHTRNFYGKFSLTFNGLNSFSSETTILSQLEKLEEKWDTPPHITAFMPYLKKLIVENKLQIIGIVAAYDKDEAGITIPFVYQILGEDIRRINIDDEGRMFYNCVYLEKKTHLGKLLHDVRLKNGDTWEDYPGTRLRCDLYSIQKSIDLCRFMLRTCHYMDNINSALYDCPLKADISIITKNNVETKLMDI